MARIIRAYARLYPDPIAKAQVELKPQPAQVLARFFAEIPKLSAYLDEYNSNPFLDDTVLTPSDALISFLVLKAAQDSQTFADAIRFNARKTLTDSLSLTDVCVAGLLFLRDFTDLVTPADAKLITMGLAKADSVVIEEIHRTLLAKVLADAVAPLDQVAKLLEKPFADPVYLGEMLQFLIGFARAFEDSITTVDTLNSFNLRLSKADAVTVPDLPAAVVIKIPAPDSVSMQDFMGFLHPRAFSEVVSMSPYGGLLNDMAMNSGLINASFGGDRVTILIAPVLADSTLGTDAYTRVLQWVRAYTDAVSLSDTKVISVTKPLADANPTMVDAFLRTVFFGRTPQDANTLLETRLTITTISVSLVPATLNRGVLNSLPLNQEGNFTTTTTVQVI